MMVARPRDSRQHRANIGSARTRNGPHPMDEDAGRHADHKPAG